MLAVIRVLVILECFHNHLKNTIKICRRYTINLIFFTKMEVINPRINDYYISSF